MDQSKLIDLEFKRDRLKFPLERRKKVLKLLVECVEFKVSLIPHKGKLSVSHSDTNPIDLHYYRLIDEYAVELCEIIERLVIFSKYTQWKPLPESFDYRFNLTCDTYLLLQQSDALYELQLVLVKEVNGKISSVRIAQGLTGFMIDSANKYATDLISVAKRK